MSLLIRRLELDDRADQQTLRDLTQGYASDPMGQGAPLPSDVLDRLIPGLQALPTTVVLAAFVDGSPAAHATCFLGFSTFTGRPLLNIHDLAVLPEHRGRGLARHLLASIEREATALGCCRVTMEVYLNNTRAMGVYEAAGYRQAGLGTTIGGALFYAKELPLERDTAAAASEGAEES